MSLATRQAPFHAFTIRHSGRASRIITDVGVSAAFDPSAPPEHPAILETKALWDTGATRSVITKKTAGDLGLVSTGMTRVNHAGGTSNHQTYVVNFFLPNNVGAPGVSVSECEDIAGDFGAIVGMDIIGGGDMAITNHAGKTTMTFRVPPFEEIDFVSQANRILFAGIGRNDPCPCGKKGDDGRTIKFKKCHGG
ncbi:MAG: hypothetical protein HYX75_00050 [Acidobacteria bacterium]|nr:hypothetical protein [Acidobacteriota bacterium]